jgi:hypothetical protein
MANKRSLRQSSLERDKKEGVPTPQSRLGRVVYGSELAMDGVVGVVEVTIWGCSPGRNAGKRPCWVGLASLARDKAVIGLKCVRDLVLSAV